MAIEQQLQTELDEVRKGCEDRCKGVQQQLSQHQRALDQAEGQRTADQQVAREKLDSIQKTLDHLCRVIEGDENGSLPARILLLERTAIVNGSVRMSQVEQHMSYVLDALKDMKDLAPDIRALLTENRAKKQTVRDAFIQASPSILTVIAVAILAFIYLMFLHFGAKPPGL